MIIVNYKINIVSNGTNNPLSTFHSKKILDISSIKLFSFFSSKKRWSYFKSSLPVMCVYEGESGGGVSSEKGLLTILLFIVK